MARTFRSGDYKRRAKAICDAARANPWTKCWRCGRTLDEHPAHKNGKRPWWTAGHVVDGSALSPLLPEASVCNFSAGGVLPHRQAMNTSRRW